MSFFNLSALAVMLKPMFPQVFARVEELEANGTLQKIQDAATEIASNGTLEALRELAGKIDEHNVLLREIRDERRKPYDCLDASADPRITELLLSDGTGMSERNEPD